MKDNINFYKIYLTILITSLLWACDNSDPIIPNPPEVDIFEVKWATRMDIERGIVNLAQGI